MAPGVFLFVLALLGRGVGLRALAVEVALDGVEDAVDELRGLVGGESSSASPSSVQ
ncbi:MAG: hypothetical protein LC800_18435 [Acidobacteria bacterium]|nr:hypothetical protein [Acidobacteriota bacterium]